MIPVLQKAHALYLHVKMQTELFDNLLAPIILYGSEFWSFEKVDGEGTSFRSISFRAPFRNLFPEFYYHFLRSKLTI